MFEKENSKRFAIEGPVSIIPPFRYSDFESCRLIFRFIDADLKTQKPGYAAPGSVTSSEKRK